MVMWIIDNSSSYRNVLRAIKRSRTSNITS